MNSALRFCWKKIGIALAILLVLVAVFLLSPPAPPPLAPPNPARDYQEALERISQIQAREPAQMSPQGRLRFMTHGGPTDRVVVFVHGYTSSPQQFVALGEEFYRLGYNVLIPPLPHHGLADRMTPRHAFLTAEELAGYVGEFLDIAQGLGRKVTMVGLSTGGVMTAWGAQHRNDLDLAVIIDPAFGMKPIPTLLTEVGAKFLSFWPNFFIWGDPERREQAPPDHAYPQFASRALGQILRLASVVHRSAADAAPKTARIAVVVNANDNRVNNDAALELVNLWARYGIELRTFEFPADLQLSHDLIDPANPNQQTHLVYPLLIRLIHDFQLPDIQSIKGE